MPSKIKLHKLLFLILFLIVLLVGLVAIAFLFINERQRTASLESAIRAFDNGNYRRAHGLFSQIVAIDPNQEQAYVYLAKIAQINGNWQEETNHWQTARRLNALSSEYSESMKLALARGRNFKGLQINFFLGDIDLTKMSDSDCYLYLLTKLRNGHTRIFDEIKIQLREKKPDFFLSDFGRLIELLDRPMLSAEQSSELARLSDSQNALIAYEALAKRVELEIRKSGFSEATEELLVQMAQRDSYCASLSLQSFYIMTYQFSKGIETAESDWERLHRYATAINLGELYLLTGKHEKIGTIHRNFLSGKKLQLQIGHYLRALEALATQNQKELIESWEGTGNIIQSPVARFTALCYSVTKDSPGLVSSAWDNLHKLSDFYDLKDRAESVLQGYIRFLLAEGRLDEAFRLLSMHKAPKFKDPGSARCYILKHFSQGTLSEKDLLDSLQAFPEDLVLLQCAAEYYCYGRLYKRSMHYVHQALKQKLAPNSGIYYIQIQNLIQYEQLDEASKIFFHLVEASPENLSMLLEYCKFAVQNDRPKDLEQLLVALENSQENAPRKALIPYVTGELLLLQGNIDQALNQFEQTRTEVPTILFRMAERLGHFDRRVPAISYYNALISDPSAKAQHAYSFANLSELYWDMGDKSAALKFAENAWKIAPRTEDFQICYAEKLLKVDEITKALQVLPSPTYGISLSPAIRPLWIQAAEREIPLQYDSMKYNATTSLCRMLLLCDPNSAVAKEYQEKIAALNQTGRPCIRDS